MGRGARPWLTVLVDGDPQDQPAIARAEPPYVVGVVELTGPHALRMVGRCEIEPSAAKTGLDVIVDFHEVRPGVSVPFWRLAGDEVASAKVSRNRLAGR